MIALPSGWGARVRRHECRTGSFASDRNASSLNCALPLPVEPKHGLTRTQAEAALRRLIDETEATPIVNGPRMSLATLDERYRVHLKRKGRKRATLIAVESACRVHLVPREDVDDLVTKLEGAELSPKSIRNYIGTLSAMLSWAKAPPRKWLASNPCEGVELPGVPESDEIRFLDDAEWDALLRHVESGPYASIDEALWLTAIEADSGTASYARCACATSLLRHADSRPAELGPSASARRRASDRAAASP